jgi:hypothetical protein
LVEPGVQLGILQADQALGVFKMLDCSVIGTVERKILGSGPVHANDIAGFARHFGQVVPHVYIVAVHKALPLKDGCRFGVLLIF